MSDITQILQQAKAGEAQARDALYEAVYQELRQMASAQLAREKPGRTLQSTARMHEAYLRLSGNQPFENRCHFFAAAGEPMRRVLVDNARRKLSAKGADLPIVFTSQTWLPRSGGAVGSIG
jgi:RNA polymerase sigma factor (TIGR02999 family)